MKAILLALLVFAFGTARAQEDAPFSHFQTLHLPEGTYASRFEYSPDSRYIVAQISDEARREFRLEQVYDIETGALLYEGDWVSWYADGSHILVDTGENAAAFNLEAREIAFTLPLPADDFRGQEFAWNHDEQRLTLDLTQGESIGWNLRIVGEEIAMYTYNEEPQQPGVMNIYDAYTGALLFSHDGSNIYSMGYLPDNELVIWNRRDGRIEIYDRTTWTMVDVLKDAMPGIENSPWWSHDGSVLFVHMHDDLTTRRWERGVGVSEPLNLYHNWWSPQGRWFMVHSSESFGQPEGIYDAATGELVKTLEFTPEYQSIDWYSDDYLSMYTDVEVDGKTDTFVHLWLYDIHTGEFIGPILWEAGYWNSCYNLDTGIFAQAMYVHPYHYMSRRLADDSVLIERDDLEHEAHLSPNCEWALVIESGGAEGEASTLLIDRLADGERFVLETPPHTNLEQIEWSFDARHFALSERGNNIVTLWRISG